ncbi:MAG: trehalose-6-phosphate synthase [Actinomycetota bacterium]|nr:trehalose-6-phosphate synthase [Actinomycetota bacterium]
MLGRASSPSRSDVVVVSNRGPLDFSPGAQGRPSLKRASGGLVVALGPGVTSSGALWVAAALSDADREAAAQANAAGAVIDAEGFRVRSLSIDPGDFVAYCDVVANGTLWYLNHGLWDLVRRPRFDRHWHDAWARYRKVNRHFADAVADGATDGATVIVHDYHLALVAGMVAARRPDLRTATFIHTPWCTAEELSVLPDEAGAELLGTMADGGPCGFHSQRWATRFQACAAEVVGRRPETFVAPAAVDTDELSRVASSPACAAELARLDAALGDRAFIVRVDRIELSKNILRGLWAFDALLDAHPQLVEGVVFGVFVYPSRLTLVDYQAYGQEIITLVDYLNAKWSTATWTPVLLDSEDNHPRSVAALRRYDVLVVNPVRDGLNLVAVEGPEINERHGTVVLSRQAGCYDLIGEQVLGINPFDVKATAEAMAAALALPAAERASRARALRAVTAELTPRTWWDQLIAGAGQSRR